MTGRKKYTQEHWLSLAVAKHGSYRYSKVVYQGKRCNVIITCPIHGDFKQDPSAHLRGAGCRLCALAERSKDSTTFSQQAQLVHGDLYDYGKVVYQHKDKPVILVCPYHGEFSQRPGNHLRGAGCYTCGRLRTGIKKRYSQDEFLEKAHAQHGARYDYSGAVYETSQQSVQIKCSTHGVFEQVAATHLQGHGCPKCARNAAHSKVAIQWLEDMAEADKTHILHAENGGEWCITLHDGKNIWVDGFSAELNKVYEFLGDYYHGNPDKFSADEVNQCAKKTMGELHEATLARKETIRSLGYNYTEIWEDMYKSSKRAARPLP